MTPAKGKRVLLKPNAGRNVEAGKGITAHPEVVAAAIDAFREAGAEVAIGESPITGVKMAEAFENCGIKAIAEVRNCPLIDMDARKSVPIGIPDGVTIRKLKLCREVAENEIIVSIPVMKTHMHTGVSLSVKNMKGCLWKRSKVDLHMLPQLAGHKERSLDTAIADMSSVLRPHLSIIDGTIGMEGLGPSAGTPKKLGVVVVGVDAFAADSIACELMGIHASEIPHLRIGAERGYGVIDTDAIRVSPEGWEKAKNPFARAPDKLSVAFPGFTILDVQSCSACQSTLLMFLNRYGKELRDKMPGGKDIVIAIGKGHKHLPEGTLCVGNCTIRHKRKGRFVPGCPPVASEILREYFPEK
ncbi:MAG: DUF362 domain-containing protein [Phycisphaerae bacterium]|nr:DUF362 domain-containing protein [Phycisphaerae bacterium]MDD5380029.1 DUF362 domain-containing protein [Phycisphaerae bacterium]